MRPPAQQQSALRTPLNSILGTEANVRILRVLARARAPMGRAELARRAGLQLPGTHKAVERLLREGIVETVGAGKRTLLDLHAGHPLTNSLQALFDAESNRTDRLLASLKSMAMRLDPPPTAMWIEGSFAAGEDRTGEALQVTVVSQSAYLDQTVDSLQTSLADLEQEHDLSVELRGKTRPDLAALSPSEWRALRNAISIFGLPPDAFDPAMASAWQLRNSVVHAYRDEQGRKLAKAIAEKLASDSSLATRTIELVQQRLRTASERERRDLLEWEAILKTKSASRLTQFLLDTSERAIRLRQTLPFHEVLTREERQAVMEPSEQ